MTNIILFLLTFEPGIEREDLHAVAHAARRVFGGKAARRRGGGKAQHFFVVHARDEPVQRPRTEGVARAHLPLDEAFGQFQRGDFEGIARFVHEVSRFGRMHDDFARNAALEKEAHGLHDARIVERAVLPRAGMPLTLAASISLRMA